MTCKPPFDDGFQARVGITHSRTCSRLSAGRRPCDERLNDWCDRIHVFPGRVVMCPQPVEVLTSTKQAPVPFRAIPARPPGHAHFGIRSVDPVHPLSTLQTPRCRDACKTRSWPVCSTLARPDSQRQVDTRFPNALLHVLVLNRTDTDNPWLRSWQLPPSGFDAPIRRRHGAATTPRTIHPMFHSHDQPSGPATSPEMAVHFRPFYPSASANSAHSRTSGRSNEMPSRAECARRMAATSAP